MHTLTEILLLRLEEQLQSACMCFSRVLFPHAFSRPSVSLLLSSLYLCVCAASIKSIKSCQRMEGKRASPSSTHTQSE